MPRRDTTPIGAPCWADLMTADTDASREFYTALFGWTADDPNPDFGGYFIFAKDGMPVAGCMASQPATPLPAVWSLYLATDDAAKSVEVARANGAEIMYDAMPVGDFGVMAVLADPTGAVIGVWQPGEHKGFGVVTEAGAPSWFELATRDHAGAVRFYRDVFRWDTQAVGDTDEFRYTVLRHGDESLAGILDASAFLPEGVPSHWSVYFGVDDTDAALERVVALGGLVLRPAEDTPYGRLATAADPVGAMFRLVAPNDAMPARQSAS